jgi:predicted glycogen debranching enzyme
MIGPVYRVSRTEDRGLYEERLLTREWLVTNGLGGYASGTIGGVATRRYHGLLVAALPAPLGRMLLLAHLSERLRLAGGFVARLDGEEAAPGKLSLFGADYLTEFRLEWGQPVWRYEIAGVAFEKRVLIPQGQNTVHITYRLLSGDEPVRLKIRPAVHFRPHDAPVSTPLPGSPRLAAMDERYEIFVADSLPTLRLKCYGQRAAFTFEPQHIGEFLYRVEKSRGYAASGELWVPGYFRLDLARDRPATLVASTEGWESIHAMRPDEVLRTELERRERLIAAASPAAQTGAGAELVLAADQFLVRPAGRVADAAWARAAGDDVRTVIAGYHWFTDWGRDTMISLDGLTLVTGRHAEAGYLLRTFAHHIRDGLIPNLFPEGQQEGLYHTADATLWFFHALHRYVTVTSDHAALELLLPKLLDIYDHHCRGTRFGIGMDPADGLLRQGAPGYQLTWMDAKVDDWVVTPRRGKAVEINALWYNAICLLEGWTREFHGDAEAVRFARHAQRVYHSFNDRFWYEAGSYLYDVVDGENGDDAACRPNQIFSISLPHPVLAPERWQAVLHTARDRLLTPMGLRSLAPGHPDYKPCYDGDLRSRDAAYHQGTVWAWLIGTFVDAWLRVYPDDTDTARSFLQGFQAHLNEACIGSISEIFDAEAPYWPRGCAAQAWSVAEVLRCWVKTAGQSANGPTQFASESSFTPGSPTPTPENHSATSESRR